MAGYSPWGCQRVRHNLATKQQTKNNNQLVNCHYLPPKLQLAMNNHQKENVGYQQKKDTLNPRTKEKPQQDGRRSTIIFKNQISYSQEMLREFKQAL